MAGRSLWQAFKENAYQAVSEVSTSAFLGIQQAYSDVLVHGRLMSHGNIGSRTALNMEIAEESYKPPQQEEFYRNEPPEADNGLEPER